MIRVRKFGAGDRHCCSCTDKATIEVVFRTCTVYLCADCAKNVVTMLSNPALQR